MQLHPCTQSRQETNPVAAAVKDKFLPADSMCWGSTVGKGLEPCAQQGLKGALERTSVHMAQVTFSCSSWGIAAVVPPSKNFHEKSGDSTYKELVLAKNPSAESEPVSNNGFFSQPLSRVKHLE